MKGRELSLRHLELPSVLSGVVLCVVDVDLDLLHVGWAMGLACWARPLL